MLEKSLMAALAGGYSYYELEAQEYLRRGVQLTPDLWLVKLLVGAPPHQPPPHITPPPPLSGRAPTSTWGLAQMQFVTSQGGPHVGVHALTSGFRQSAISALRGRPCNTWVHALWVLYCLCFLQECDCW